jgi:hypothetical protein
MPVTIGAMTAEVVAEPDNAPAAEGPAKEGAIDVAAIRTTLATIARQAMRTRAEGFDD